MILIIDDDIAVRSALMLLLENEGYKVAAAESANEALNVLHQNLAVRRTLAKRLI